MRSGSLGIGELYDLLCGILKVVGASWQAGETRVWQEHFATATVRTIVEACHPLVIERAASPVGRTVLLATPPEEYHDLGLRFVADRFELAGWSVHLLGASLPVEEMTQAVGALRADAVVLSASTHFHRIALRSYVDTLRTAHPGLRVWVGGTAFAIEHHGWSSDELLDIAAIPSLAAAMG